MVRGSYLSDKELLAFGVIRTKDRWSGRARYTVPCDVCGKLVETGSYNTESVYMCKECTHETVSVRNRIKELAKWKNYQESEHGQGISYESYHRFDSAVKKFSDKYSDAIEKAKKYANVFDSTPEVIACIELLYIGVKVIAHQKVGSYTVDFCLPDEKLVVEIDGSLYHNDDVKDFWRDSAIKNMLGGQWEIKHVPADAVANDHAAFGRLIRKAIDSRHFELKA